MHVTGVNVKSIATTEAMKRIAASTTTAASPNVNVCGHSCRERTSSLLNPKLLNIPRTTVKTIPKQTKHVYQQCIQN